MTRTHDFRLLGASLVCWGVLASMLAMHAHTGTYALVSGGAIVASVASLGSESFARLRRNKLSPHRLNRFSGRALGMRGRSDVDAGQHDRIRGTLQGRQRASGGVVRAAALVCACLAVVTAAGGAHEWTSSRGPAVALAGQHASATMTVRVDGSPRLLPPTQFATEPRYLLPVRVLSIEARGHSHAVSTPAVLVGASNAQELTWRSKVHIKGRLAPSDRLGEARVVIQARGAGEIVRQPAAPLRVVDHLRSRFAASTDGLPTDARGLVPALVMGDTTRLPEQLNADMNATGMSHLNAVSGSNVTIVLVAMLWCAGWCSVGRRGRLIVGAMAVVVFVAVCRPEPSVIRAAAMGAVGVVGTTVGRPRSACPALGAAVIVLICWSPWLALNAGFALSSLATLGLVLFARPWSEALSGRAPAWMAKPIEITMIPIAAQALCLPILVVLSGGMSLVSVPANVAAEPLVAPATLIGLAVFIIAAVCVPLAALLAWVAALPTLGIAVIAHVSAGLPWATMPWPTGVWGVVLISIVLVVALWAHRAIVWTSWGGLGALGTTVALVAAWLVPIPGAHAVAQTWRYAQCEVGQGDAEMVRTAPGHAVLIDVGPKESDGLFKCLKRHRVTTIDAIVLSHFHADHVGALPAVLDKYPVASIYVTWVTEGADEGGFGEKGELAPTTKTATRHGAKLIPLAAGSTIEVSDVHMTVLWPKRVVREGSVQNNASLVMDIEASDLHALTLGDLEKEAQSAVTGEVAQRARVRAYDVIKVAHHGSSNQSQGLYEAAHAQLALVGVGRNDYGHPTKKTLSMLADFGAETYRTDTMGDITVADTGAGPRAAPEKPSS